MPSLCPRARRDGLTVQPMDQELVIYDPATDKTRLLNRTAATIWQHSDGRTPVSKLAEHLSQELGAAVDESLVWFTLEQLKKQDLMEAHPVIPARYARMTRRDFIRAGLVGAAVLLPVVVSITTPSPARAGSCLASGEACATSD